MSIDAAQWEDLTSSGTVVKAAKIPVGDCFQGTLISVEKSSQYPDKDNLVMEDADGNEFLVHTSGSLSYAVKDGKLDVGRTYLITRLENKVTTRGASRTEFRIQRLKADGSAAAPKVESARPAGKAGKR